MSSIARGNTGETEVIGSSPLWTHWFAPWHDYTLPEPIQTCHEWRPGSQEGQCESMPFQTWLHSAFWWSVGIQYEHHCHLYAAVAYHFGKWYLCGKPFFREGWAFTWSKPKLWSWLARHSTDLFTRYKTLEWCHFFLRHICHIEMAIVIV